MLYREVDDQIGVFSIAQWSFYLRQGTGQGACLKRPGNLFRCHRIWGLIALSASAVEPITHRTLSDAFGCQMRWNIVGNSSPNLWVVPSLG